MNSNYTDRLPEDFPRDLLESAVSLESVGLSELAWRAVEAVQVINELAERGYVILGGDVLVEESGRLTHTYDNWFVDKDRTVPWEELVRKSRDVAVSYVERYSRAHEGSFYYTIVFESLEEAKS